MNILTRRKENTDRKKPRQELKWSNIENNTNLLRLNAKFCEKITKPRENRG